MSQPAEVAISQVDHLDAGERDQVVALAHDAELADGTSPLDDQVRLDLANGNGDERTHLLASIVATGAEQLAGYAHLDLRTPGAANAHLVVAPTVRGRGVGSELAARLGEIARDRSLRVWAHGDAAAAAAFAARLGWQRQRELRQLRLPITHPIAEPVIAPGVTIRTFVPGTDDEAWVAVNARAFSDHPEQGRLTVEDLRQRQRQDWFDPAGLFVAERAEAMIGFHWTKVHADTDPPLGEVYVLGVDPSAQGLGLGKALTLVGLHHLRQRGLDVILYVDADNTAAVALYDRLGFTISKVDVMYARSTQA